MPPHSGGNLIRVTVDGAPVIENWSDHATTTDVGTMSLTAGSHEVVVDYYENKGAATAVVSWAPAST